MTRKLPYSSWSLTKPAPSVRYLLTRLQASNKMPHVVIDLGCGNLRNVVPFLERFSSIKIIAVDKINIFKKKWPPKSNFLSLVMKKYPKQFTFIQIDLENIPMLDAVLPHACDVVLCNYVFQNITPSLYPLLLRKIADKSPQFFFFFFYSNNTRPKGIFVRSGGLRWYTPKENSELEDLLRKQFKVVWKSTPSSSKYSTSRVSTWSFLLQPPKNPFKSLQ